MSRIGSLVRGLAIVVLAVGAAGVAYAPAQAQCGEPPKSSCATCHEKEDPVSTKGEWHQIHAAKDICTSCHGGNASAADKAGAHQTLVAQPLSDIYTDCHSCHPDDYSTRADRFATALGVTPASCATPTAVPVGLSGGAPVVISPAPAGATPAPQAWPLALVALLTTAVVALAALAGFAMARRLHLHA